CSSTASPCRAPTGACTPGVGPGCRSPCRDSCPHRGGTVRVLQVVPPLAGHVNPTLALGRALSARGHEVAWVAYPEAVAPLLPEGATLLPLAHDLSADAFAALRAEGEG